MYKKRLKGEVKAFSNEMSKLIDETIGKFIQIINKKDKEILSLKNKIQELKNGY